MDATIIDLDARQLLDSRGNPTLEVEVFTQEFIGAALVPSGASTGKHECVELRDGGAAYGGLGVTKAVQHVLGPIAQQLIGTSILHQAELDDALCALDGTSTKKKLGANALLGVSLAVSRAASAAHEMPLYAYLASLTGKPLDTFTLPLPFANVINGGKHAQNALMFQEFMIVPHGAKTFAQAVQLVSEVYHELKKTIAKKYGAAQTNVGDEGGFAPDVATPIEALDLLTTTLKRMKLEKKVGFALDPAASEFFTKKTQLYEAQQGVMSSGEELAKYYLMLCKTYPILSLEDPFAEDDFASWNIFMELLAKTPAKQFAAGYAPQVVGDDLTVTNTTRIQQAADKNLCNSLLLKVNQIGTLSEALAAATLAFSHDWTVMVSHRSGETEDPYIADLAVGLGCGQIKLGAPCRSDRTAKYNQLLRIAGELGTHGTLAKFTARKA